MSVQQKTLQKFILVQTIVLQQVVELESLLYLVRFLVFLTNPVFYIGDSSYRNIYIYKVLERFAAGFPKYRLKRNLSLVEVVRTGSLRSKSCTHRLFRMALLKQNI